jgi:peptidoglycan/LPS O-acetylase OafA/YrhL
MTLGEALRSGHSGNLNLLRLGLAIAVIVSHAWPLALGPGTPEPLEALTGRSLGGWAVGVFFFVSGLLIAASAERKRPGAFWAARARRIVPGLAAALIVTLCLAMASGSTAGPAETIAWFARAVTLVSIEHRLSAAFAANPMPEIANGPLWSLAHEVFAYVICAGAVWFGVTRRWWSMAALVAGACAFGIAENHITGRLATFAPLFAAFTFGMVAHVLRDRIHLTGLSILIAVPLLCLLPGPLALGGVGFGLVVLALRLPEMAQQSDASFGLYIYGWPVAQTLMALLPGIGPHALALLSLGATFPLALLSWHVVERPSLGGRWGAA